MDRITTIESKITGNLQKIDGTTQSTGYKYYSNTGTVQVYDEVLSLSRNTTTVGETNKGVNYLLELDEGEGITAVGAEDTFGQSAYTNRAIYVITAKVHNNGDEGSPLAVVRERMNEVLCDMLFVFGKDHTLGGTVNWINFINSYREFEDISNNRIQTGSVIARFEVVFNQCMNNPDENCCY